MKPDVQGYMMWWTGVRVVTHLATEQEIHEAPNWVPARGLRIYGDLHFVVDVTFICLAVIVPDTSMFAKGNL
jgi:hypothetical protein